MGFLLKIVKRKPNTIENTIFKNLGYFKNQNNFLTGGLNFYKTKLKIDNVEIFNSSGRCNKYCEIKI